MNPLTHKGRIAKRSPKTFPYQSAREAIGTLTPGIRITGVTKGQFSLLDLIRAIAEQTGPASLTVSTWSTGIRDTENLSVLIDRGMFTSVALCLDRSFAGRQPQYLAAVVKTWGCDNIRMTRNHAKFYMIRNSMWNICIRSSMNLNRNPRLEQYDIDDSTELCDFFQAVIGEVFEKMPPGLTRSCEVCDPVFVGLIGGGLSDQYATTDISELMIDLTALENK